MTMLPSQYLKARRKELNLTIDQIAEKLGVNNGTVSRWENGQIDNMRRDKIAMLAEILQISPLTILGIEENKEEKKPLSAREFMKIICKGDPEALAIVERLQLTDEGNLKIAGADAASQAVLEHQIKGLISALKSAKLQDDGSKRFEYPPKDS